MNGMIKTDNAKVRPNFYPEIFIERRENNWAEEIFRRDEKNNRHDVPENVSKLFKAAQESGYSPISLELFQKDDDTDAAGNTHGIVLNPGASTHKAIGRKSSPAECETCANRKYQDGSDENDVSFKTPSHIPQSIAATVVLGHEHEHVANAYEKERNGEAKVQSVSVRLHNDICPECGRVYVAGGVTHTHMKYSNDDNPYEKEQKNNDKNEVRGAVVDVDS